MQALLAALGKAAISIGMKFMAEEFLEALFVWAGRKLASSTKTKVDDELMDFIEEKLDA